MTLAADEFRAHLELSAATAGITLPEIVLPDERQLLLERMRFHYLDWGTPGLPPVSSCTAAASTPIRGISSASRCAVSGTAWRSTSAATARASGHPR